MTTILSEWRIGRILPRKKTGLLKRAGYFVSNGLTITDAQCNVGIFEQIRD